MRRLLITAIVIGLGLVSVAPPTEAANANLGAGPEALDRQQLVYEINLARWNPVAYEQRVAVSWTRPPARPPLALEEHLLESSQFKADEMAAGGYFAHRSQTTGVWPNQLVRTAGYPLTSDFGDRANNVESLHSGSPTALNVLTSFAESPTHKRHVFGESWFQQHRDIGVGRSTFQNFWVVHTAYGSETTSRVTGVVFDDLDGDLVMDPGEGLAGIKVRLGSTTDITNAGGGYVFDVEPGTHLITAYGDGFRGTTTVQVVVGEYNLGIDFVSGDPLPIVRSYALCEGLEPTILGTSRDDVLVGTPDDDVIHGLGGRDLIDGNGGNDIICRDADPAMTGTEVMSFLHALRKFVSQPW